MAKAWRPEDEARLRHLEDEALLETLWARWAGPAASLPHPRAAGVFAELRRHPLGTEALEAAERGDLGRLLQLLSAPPPELLTGALAHHLALLHAQLACERETREEAAARRTAVDAWLASQAMWLHLVVERRYLARLGRTVVGDALPTAELTAELDEVAFTTVRQLGRRALSGAATLDEPSRIALRALAQSGWAAERTPLPEATANKLSALARRAREHAVEAALGATESALEEAVVTDAPADRLVPLLQRGAAVWAWAARDRIVVHTLVEHITPYLWERYRDKDWDALVALLAPLEAMVDQLAIDIEGDPRQLAYSAPCAQMLVFRAEVAATFDQQLALAERALAICPSHRNGRLFVADFLVERATTTMARSMFLDRRKRQRIAADLARAESLFPQLKRLPDAKDRFAKAGGAPDE